MDAPDEESAAFVEAVVVDQTYFKGEIGRSPVVQVKHPCRRPVRAKRPQTEQGKPARTAEDKSTRRPETAPLPKKQGLHSTPYEPRDTGSNSGFSWAMLRPKRRKRSAYLTPPFATPQAVDLGNANGEFFTNAPPPNLKSTAASKKDENRVDETPLPQNQIVPPLTAYEKAASSTRTSKKRLFENIDAIRETLPLDFLFEHNLSGFVVERGLKKARAILEKFRNRALSAGFEHWVIWTIDERDRIAAEKMDQFALLHGQERLKTFLKKMLYSKIAKGFTKWTVFFHACRREERIAAAKMLQACYRGRKLHRVLYRRHMLRIYRKVTIVQCQWRRKLAGRLLRVKARRDRILYATLRLQRIIRGHLGRLRCIERRLELRQLIIAHLNAMHLQRVIRGWLGKMRYRRKLVMRNAVRRIQSLFRGRRDRREVLRYKSEYLDNVMECIEMMLEAAARNNAAASFQELFRHHQIKTMLLSIAGTIEDSQGTMGLLMEEAEKHVAAYKIQGAFQTFSIARMMQRLSESIMARIDSSSRRIQHMARLHHGRQMVRLWLERFHVETKMAVRMQAAIRGKFGRAYAKEEYRIKKTLVHKVTQRFIFRRHGRVRRNVLRRWREERTWILRPQMRAWNRLARATRVRRSARKQLYLVVIASREMARTSQTKAIRVWQFYVSEEKRLRALLRKAYSYWASLAKAAALRQWEARTRLQVWYRKQVALVFMNCAALETWNSSVRRPGVLVANAHRTKQVWKIMNMFLEWRRDRIAQAVEYYEDGYWKWDASFSIEMLDRYKIHRKEHKRRLALAEKYLMRRRRKQAAKHWAAYNDRRKAFYELRQKGDRWFFDVHGGKHFRAWRVEAARIVQLRMLAQRALKHWVNQEKSQSWRTWSTKAKVRGIMRKVLIHMTRTRYIDPMFYKWIRQAKRVKDALEFRSAQAIQKIWRKIFALKLRSDMVAKRDYLFNIRVAREQDVLSLNAFNASKEMTKFHMVLVHFYAPFSETGTEKKEFATAASTFVDKAGRKLNFGHMSQVVEERDQWSKQLMFRVNSRIQFAKMDATEANPSDYGRSMGVRFRVIDIPTIRLYWRYGRRGGKAENQKDPDPQFAWVGENYPGPFNAVDICNWTMKKVLRLREQETPAVVQMQRICRGWYARFVKVRGNAAEEYWKREPLWVRKTDRQGKEFYLNRLTGVVQFNRPDGYETPRGEPPKKQKLGALLTQMEDGELNPDDPAWGIPSPLRYKQAALCKVCENDLATWKCLDACDVPMCDSCMEESHLTGSYQSHRIVSVHIESLHKNAQMCGTCEVRAADMVCNECEDTYCMECYKLEHAKGRRLFHKYVLREEKKSFKKLAGKGNLAHEIIKRRNWKTIAQFQIEHAAREKAAAQKKARMDSMREVVQKAFDRYDKDHSGSIDINEVSEMMREELHEPMDGQDLEECMTEMDKDGNGVIDFEEFLDWFTSESVYGRQSDDFKGRLLKAMRFKMRMEATALKAARKVGEVTETALAKGMNKLSLGIDKLAELKQRVDERIDATQKQAYNKLVPEKIKDMIENPLVPGTVVPPIDFRAFKDKKDVFVRWCREEFLIDIPPADWLEDDKARDAFEEIFIPTYNAGKLKLRHYHDGRIFTHNDARWRQEWVGELIAFQYRNLKTNEVEKLDPAWLESCETAAREKFEEYDKDNSDALSEKELKALMGWELCKPVKGRNLKKMLVEMDLDGDGVISYDEFLPWYAENTDPNGNNGEWVRDVQQKALEAALVTRKVARNSAVVALEVAKAAAKAGRNRAFDKFAASSAYLKLVHELKYERDAVEKAVMLCSQDFDKSLEWLVREGYKPTPPLTKEELKMRRRSSIAFRAKKQIRAATKESKFASRLLTKIGLSRLLVKDKDDSSSEDSQDDY